MSNISYVGLLIVTVIAFAAPFLLSLTPARRLPAVVLQLIAGIIVGPYGLGWVKIDVPLQILSLFGLAFLLFLAGLEIELHRLKGRLLNASAGFLLSFILALPIGYLFFESGQVKSPLLIAIIFAATSLGVIIPLLKDANETYSDFGQLVIAHSMVSQFGSTILLALFFSQTATNRGILRNALVVALFLGSLVFLAVALTFIALRLERSVRLTSVLQRLQDTTAQIRVRGTFMLLVSFVVLVEFFGLDIVLGAFLVGVILRLIDGDKTLTHPQFHQKLDAIGYGVFIPIFVVTTGLRFDLPALLASPATILRVPLFLLTLLLVRGVPVLLYRSHIGNRRAVAAGLFQATSLPFIIATTQIGTELGLLSSATSAALVGAGVLSVLIFPACAVLLL